MTAEPALSIPIGHRCWYVYRLANLTDRPLDRLDDPCYQLPNSERISDYLVSGLGLLKGHSPSVCKRNETKQHDLDLDLSFTNWEL
ncbi:hypothetical protein ACLKA6_007934 [Drosophila palustris]